MSKEKYTALVLGANGLIGSEVLRLLLNNEKYSCVYAISRADIPFINDKLHTIIANYDDVLSKINDIHIDHLFCCLGTTKSKVADTDEYYKIDHDYPVKVSQYLVNKGCKSIHIVTSVGANTASSSFYLKLKGEVEESIKALGFESTNIYRPSLLIGKRNEKRPLEKIAQAISPLLDLLWIGNLKKYQSVKATEVASAMINIALLDNPGIQIYHTKEIKEKA